MKEAGAGEGVGAAEKMATAKTVEPPKSDGNDTFQGGL